jgi:hypothetical protein
VFLKTDMLILLAPALETSKTADVEKNDIPIAGGFTGSEV